MAIARERRTLIYTHTTVSTASGAYTMTEEVNLVLAKATPATTAVTLPSSPTTGRMVTIKDGNGDAATYNITITPASGNVDGSASYVISENYGAVTLLYNGTQWNVANSANTVSSTELGFLNGVTAGTAAASKALVLGASGEIATITTATITTLTSTLVIEGGRRMSDIGSIAAAGSAIGNATAVVNRVQIVTGADDTKGVVLPATVAGNEYFIYSSQATNGLKVYPAVNSTLNDGSANASITIEGKTMAHFIATSSTNWAVIFTANA